MKLRDVYTSYQLIGALILMLLGIGNWIVGTVQVSQYEKLVRNMAKTGLEESYRNFQQLNHRKNEELLRRINEDREKHNAAQVKIDFYYVVLGGGRLLFFGGLFLTFFALIRLIREDTLTKIGRINSRLLRTPK